MQEKALDASNANGAEARPPRASEEELARIRGGPDGQPDPLRERIMEAMLIASGEHGYHEVSVARVLEYYGGHRAQFYALFANKAECYAAAYEFEAGRLCSTLLGVAMAAGGWREGLRAALAELARFASERPLVAKGLLVQVHAAGEPALAIREEVIERLTRAIDGARHETESSHSPPPMTSRFMIGAVEEFVCARLGDGDLGALRAGMPELAQMVVAAYFGEEAGREELALGRGRPG
jgi:AcrR family transcriptional regulator